MTQDDEEDDEMAQLLSLSRADPELRPLVQMLLKQRALAREVGGVVGSQVPKKKERKKKKRKNKVEEDDDIETKKQSDEVEKRNEESENHDHVEAELSPPQRSDIQALLHDTSHHDAMAAFYLSQSQQSQDSSQESPAKPSPVVSRKRKRPTTAAAATTTTTMSPSSTTLARIRFINADHKLSRGHPVAPPSSQVGGPPLRVVQFAFGRPDCLLYFGARAEQYQAHRSGSNAKCVGLVSDARADEFIGVSEPLQYRNQTVVATCTAGGLVQFRSLPYNIVVDAVPSAVPIDRSSAKSVSIAVVDEAKKLIVAERPSGRMHRCVALDETKWRAIEHGAKGSLVGDLCVVGHHIVAAFAPGQLLVLRSATTRNPSLINLGLSQRLTAFHAWSVSDSAFHVVLGTANGAVSVARISTASLQLVGVRDLSPMVHVPPGVHACVATKRLSYIFVGLSNGQVAISSARTGQLVAMLRPGGAPVHSISFSAHERRLLITDVSGVTTAYFCYQ